MMPLDSPRLPTKTFWKQFVSKHWDRAPFVFKGLVPKDFVTSDQVLSAIVKASDANRAGDNSTRLRLFLEYETDEKHADQRYAPLQVLNPLPYLPLASDRTLKSYFDRLGRKFQGQRCGLVLNECSRWEPSYWARTRALFDGLFDCVGTPGGGTMPDLFIGNYRHTPFGVHKDEQHVFTLVASGRKRMALWPYSYFSNRSEIPKGSENTPTNVSFRSAKEYAQAKRDALILEAGPGDLMYWPASYFHQAEPSPTLTATLAVGLQMEAVFPYEFELGKLLSGRAPTLKLTPKDLVGQFGARGISLPKSVDRFLKMLRSRPFLSHLESSVLQKWFLFQTGAGFRAAPNPAAPKGLGEDEWIRLADGTSLVWMERSVSQLLISANGQMAETAAHPKLIALLKVLNQGKAHRVGALLKQFSGKAERRNAVLVIDRGTVQSILELIETWRAIQRVPHGIN
jgi:ribosomal protein L16 Arg81 hydroxylase